MSIDEIVTVARVMDQLRLGPNGGLVYCMEFLERNMDWLRDRLAQFPGAAVRAGRARRPC